MDTTRREVVRFQAGERSVEADTLAVEAPIEFRLGSVPIAVLMRSPGMERELALGFCLTEGILVHPSEFTDLVPLGDGDRHLIELTAGVTIDPERFRRNLFTTSSCGVCGKASIDAVRIASRGVPPGPHMTIASLAALPQRLEQSQEAFGATGAIHAAGIFDADGELLASAEDIGRHNAVDKAIGARAGQAWPLGETVLCVSGRISFEITQKAAVAGIPIVVGVSAASSLAVELAEDVGMTVIGFVRGESAVVYTDRNRVTSDGEETAHL